MRLDNEEKRNVMQMALDACRIAFDRSATPPSCDQIAIEIIGMYEKMLKAIQEKVHD